MIIKYKVNDPAGTHFGSSYLENSIYENQYWIDTSGAISYQDGLLFNQPSYAY